MRGPSLPLAGDGLLQPLSLVALVGLLVNDHVLKGLAAGTPWGLLTGKLSDCCGLLFLPVLLVAASEILASCINAFRGPSARAAVVVAVVVAALFCLMKTVPWVGARYVDVVSVLQWPGFALVALIDGSQMPGLRRVAHVVDPTDLIALPFAFSVVWQTQRRARRVDG